MLSDGYINLSKVLIAKDKNEEAFKLVTRGEKYHPKNIKLMIQKAIAVSNQKKYKEALKIIEEIEKIDQNDQELAYIKGKCLLYLENAQNAISSAAWIGSFAMDLIGLGGLGSLTRAATNVATVGSQFFLMNPWGRDQELEADRLGMLIIHWAGYDISQIPHFWQAMSSQNSNEHDFFSTHPADSKRIAAMNELIVEIESGADFHLRPAVGEVPSPKEEFRDAHLTENDVRYCQNCGAQIGAKDNFCTNCGYKLK